MVIILWSQCYWKVWYDVLRPNLAYKGIHFGAIPLRVGSGHCGVNRAASANRDFEINAAQRMETRPCPKSWRIVESEPMRQNLLNYCRAVIAQRLAEVRDNERSRQQRWNPGYETIERILRKSFFLGVRLNSAQKWERRCRSNHGILPDPIIWSYFNWIHKYDILTLIQLNSWSQESRSKVMDTIHWRQSSWREGKDNS